MQYILRNPVQNKSQFLCIILGHLKAFMKTILRKLFSEEEAWEIKDLVMELCYPPTYACFDVNRVHYKLVGFGFFSGRH